MLFSMVLAPAVFVAADAVRQGEGIAAEVITAARADEADLIQGKAAMFLFQQIGLAGRKITVSPLAGVPAKPQLALLFQ